MTRQRRSGGFPTTTARYLEVLTKEGFLSKRSAGRANYYVNTRLVDLFSEAHGSTNWQ
ncbi:MAG: hypothetical protein OXH83_19580 [Bryobacterales bacterium]|nr:hypothetical protein [Bryobacterales bacterium]